MSDSIREGETVTQFTMRVLCNEVIERCAQAVDSEALEATSRCEEDLAYNQAIADAARAVRALKD